METPTPDELEKMLYDLSGSFIPGTRRYAAQTLGQLATSSAEVVQALAAAVATDSDPEVRTAAVLALQAQVHQDFIKDHPDLMQQAIESAVRGQQQHQREADEKITAAFQRVLGQERAAYIIFLVAIFGAFGGFILLMVLEVQINTLKSLLPVLQIGTIAAAIVFAVRSWRKYRCPNCDGWLGGFKAGINVWFAAPPLKCPHCGTRLM